MPFHRYVSQPKYFFFPIHSLHLKYVLNVFKNDNSYLIVRNMEIKKASIISLLFLCSKFKSYTCILEEIH